MWKIKRTDFKRLSQGLLRMNMMIPSYYYDKGNEDECRRILDDIVRIANETEFLRRNKRERLTSAYTISRKGEKCVEVESLEGNLYQRFEVVECEKETG